MVMTHGAVITEKNLKDKLAKWTEMYNVTITIHDLNGFEVFL
jgi:hypothetical protein